MREKDVTVVVKGPAWFRDHDALLNFWHRWYAYAYDSDTVMPQQRTHKVKCCFSLLLLTHDCDPSQSSLPNAFIQIYSTPISHSHPSLQPCPCRQKRQKPLHPTHLSINSTTPPVQSEYATHNATPPLVCNLFLSSLSSVIILLLYALPLFRGKSTSLPTPLPTTLPQEAFRVDTCYYYRKR